MFGDANTGVEDDVVDDEQQDGNEQQAEEQELEEISIGGVEAPATEASEQDSTAIRQVREAHREEQKKRKELERKLAEVEAKAKPAEEQAPVVGAKPTMEQHDFDADAYEVALEKWHEQKAARAAFELKKQSTKNDEEEAHKKVVAKYYADAAALPVDKAKYKAAEAEVLANFSILQQNILLKSNMMPRLVYAIGNNPAKLEEIAKITDPIALAYELGRTEKSLTSTKQNKSAPQPDRPLTGGTSTTDSALERLEAEAEKTGDRTKVAAYKKLKRQNTK